MNTGGMIEGSVLWTVVISDTAERPAPWWLRWLRPGFRHVLLYRPIGSTAWLVVDPQTNGINVSFVGGVILAAAGATSIEDYLAGERGSLQVVRCRAHRSPRLLARGLVTCVSVAKHILGIRAWWVLTPAQLHRHIVKGGQ